MGARGRPRIQRDEKIATLIKALTRYGIPEREIPSILRDQGYRIGFDVMVKLYRDEIDAGHQIGNAKILETAYKQAVGGNTSMLIFLMKTRLGYRETNRVEMTSPDGSMSPQAAVSVDLSNCTPDEIAAMCKAAFRGE